MPHKTISLSVLAYERLKRAKRDSSESFSDVVMRAHWEGEPVTGAEYLRLVRERAPVYLTEHLDAVQAAKREERPPEDKWMAG